MTTMNISVPDEMKAFIEARLISDGYESASEYLRSLIRDAQQRQARLELEAKLREALESGPAQPLTREDWVAMRQEALAGMPAETIRP